MNETGTIHMVEFSNSDGIANEVTFLLYLTLLMYTCMYWQLARQAIQSIVYLNYELEPRAFDDTGAPLLRKVYL